MKLYEINNEIETLLNQGVVDIETGEVLDEELYEKLKELEVDWREKVDSIAGFIKGMNADINAISKEIDTLAHRNNVKKRKVEWLTNYLNSCLSEQQVENYESARCRLSYRGSTSIRIDIDPKELPTKYRSLERVYTPDKNKLKEDIKDGKTIKGVSLVNKKNLQIK